MKRLARQRRQTRSAVVREAIAVFEREQAAASRHQHGPWDAMAHLIGSADSRGDRLSEETGDRFRALLERKARARRAG